MAGPASQAIKQIGETSRQGIQIGADIATASTAWRRSRRAATTQWGRDTEAATTAYGRSSTEAQTSRDFQERMSSTAYQRGMEDLKAAGLNPMLAYTKGGASTPGGAQGTAQKASAGMASGPQAKINLLQGQLINSQIQTAQQLARLTGAKADGQGYDNVKKRMWAEIYTRGINAVTGTAKALLNKMPPPPTPRKDARTKAYWDGRKSLPKKDRPRTGSSMKHEPYPLDRRN